MKKLYLLSAAALMAFAANAQDTFGWTEGGGSSAIEVAAGAGNTGDCLKAAMPAAAANVWDLQFVTPSFQGLEGQVYDIDNLALIEFRFWAKYDGNAEKPVMRMAAEKTVPFNQTFAGTAQQITDESGEATKLYFPDLTLSNDWQQFSYGSEGDCFIGKGGADSIRCEFDCGFAGGETVYFDDFELLINDAVAYSENFGGSAISEAASINAFVANNVLYASEVSNIVVYNINGVAVLSANASSLDLNSLKAGLYVAKVNGAAVKFVK